MLVFHPSVAPFVQQAARALHEAGHLDQFWTTLRPDPSSRLQQFGCGVARLAGWDLRVQLGRRTVSEIPAEFVRSSGWREWLRLAVGLVDRSGRASDLVWEWAERGFDRHVARELHAGLGGVYGFEHSSLTTFEAARVLGLRVIYDVPAPEPMFVRTLLDREAARFPALDTPYRRHTAVREQRRLARRRAEWNSADVIVVNSEFTRRTYLDAGLDGARIRVVPYGAPPPAPRDAALQAGAATAPLQLLWAGTFGIRKGAHYLLEAWRAHQLGRHARLVVLGSVTLPRILLADPAPGVEYRGPVSRSELLDVCQRSDALIFPTLCDGFGLVVTEAFSRGLPVITTDRAGAADLVRPGVNGLLIPAANREAIAEVITWCLEHRNELHAMREAALDTAARWQWADYRRQLVTQLRAAGVLPVSA